MRSSRHWGAGDDERLSPVDRLTNRERQILERLGRGLDDKEIAADLGTSVATVRTHLRNAMRALDARSRTHAVMLMHGHARHVSR